MIPARDTPDLVGAEPLRYRGEPLAENVLSFWRWSSSELVGNALRGWFAEYAVAIATGASSPHRREWDGFDLETPEGTTVEVKSASYLQSWTQRKHSTIGFAIAPKRRWNESRGDHHGPRVRAADVYVFCVLDHRDEATVEPLDLDQWTFHVLPTFVLDERCGDQGSIALGPLRSLGAVPCDFGELAERVKAAGARAAERTERASPEPGSPSPSPVPTRSPPGGISRASPRPRRPLDVPPSTDCTDRSRT